MSTSKKILKKKMEFFEKNGYYPTFVIMDVNNYSYLLDDVFDFEDDVEEDVDGPITSYEGMIIAVVQKDGFNEIVLV